MIGRPRRRVLFATTEFAPWVKTGGLGDISASLPRALAGVDCEVAIVLPAYEPLLATSQATRELCSFEVSDRKVRLLAGHCDGERVFLIDCPELFRRDGSPYADPLGQDFADNAERFALFGRALERLVAIAPRFGFAVDLVHLNDWPTALAAGFIAANPRRPRILFSIHNLAYQGLFDAAQFSRLGLPRSWWSPEGIEFHGRLSFIKAGIVFADAINTVSPTYAAEIQRPEFGFGLDGLLRHNRNRLHGILNGIDEQQWNPQTDQHIPSPYSADTLARKLPNKAALQEALGLERQGEVMLLGVVSRLAHQKGVDLLAGAVEVLMALPVQLAVLGSGDSTLESSLAAAAARFPGRIAFVRGMHEGLAHLLQAGSDVFIMPSRYEPCGLSQLYSLRYGTVPVVRCTGGLSDTVSQVWGAEVGTGTGFLFDDPTADALVGTLRSVVDLFRLSSVWTRIQRNGMAADYSWARSAEAYRRLYDALLESTADA